jgi:uncharacterized protein YaiI (UPF0178 family)
LQIWVDADACPQVIKEILYRAAERAQVLTTLVANMPLRTPPSPFIRSVRVAKGFDVADHRIAQEVQPGDLVVTADIPLAAEVIGRGAHALVGPADRQLFANHLDRFLTRRSPA